MKTAEHEIAGHKATEYEIARDFAAVPPEQVYAAWTRPERLARWFGPRIFTTPPDRVVLDPRPGGSWQATMLGEDGFEVTLGGVYREAVPPARLVFTTGDPDDPGDAPASVVTVTLEERPDGTAMRFHQFGINTTAEHAEQARAGWMEFFDRLTEHLAAKLTPIDS
ncbi:SRPBCC domain-containing protein [Spongiactinospora sp. TRM90649]|uniref:SRPBCC family protein n=1 Tax=Spongiactinospora sp. TRM90649 TaxID=3031114 RepID=UPI0023F8CA09|nr:SRPBCC domain-containing protein [Spongiactinospora sp. TRM90649]MDF5751385.1 SRPBCC domain-containing protein [Spongiactinospora sp. TRM90649]